MEAIVMPLMIVFLGGLYVWEKVLAKRERAELLNRIMARSFAEYAKHTKPPDLSLEEALEQLNETVPVS